MGLVLWRHLVLMGIIFMCFQSVSISSWNKNPSEILHNIFWDAHTDLTLLSFQQMPAPFFVFQRWRSFLLAFHRILKI